MCVLTDLFGSFRDTCVVDSAMTSRPTAHSANATSRSWTAYWSSRRGKRHSVRCVENERSMYVSLNLVMRVGRGLRRD